MTHRLWQKKLKLNYSENVFDIVQFGSSVEEESNPNDIDIAVIFQKIPLKDQLAEAQMIKRQLEKQSELPIHIKSFDLYSFFDKGNFAMKNIMFYGKSVISGEYFSKGLNLTPALQISYYFDEMEKKDKVRFHYMLQGRAGKYGMLRKYGGRMLSPGLIEIEPKYVKIFEESIRKITQNYEIKEVFYPV